MAVGLRIPTGYSPRWLSKPDDSDVVKRLIASSLDACLYHAPAYVEFSRAENGYADVLWLMRDGNPVVGVPLHRTGRRRFTTAYASLLFPPEGGERSIRRGVSAISELLKANRRMYLQVLQSPQAPAYADRARMTTIAWQFDEHRLQRPFPLLARARLPAPEQMASEPIWTLGN